MHCLTISTSVHLLPLKLGVCAKAYVVSNAPAAQPIQPKYTSPYSFNASNCSQRYCRQELLDWPPPVSVRNASRWLARSQSPSAAKASELLVVQVVEVPLPSASKYACTSKIRLVVVPSRFVMLLRAAAEPSETKLVACVQSFPGRRIFWAVAPDLRIAVTASWTVAAQRVMSTSCWVGCQPWSTSRLERTLL